MIKLAFVNVEKSNVTSKTKKVTDSIFFSAFEGDVILLIDETKFIAGCPVLGFARALKAFCVDFSHGEKFRVYVRPTSETYHEWHFQLGEDNRVTVSSVHRKSGRVELTATVSLDELTAEANNFLDRVVSHCSEFCPEIKNNATIQRWLTDFSIPSFTAFMGP